MSLRHVRDGVELEPVEVNDHYDFNYQKFSYFYEDRTILPGDNFIIHCTFDTTDRDDMVLAGESTSEEMCIAFVLVYPAPDFQLCGSGISWDAKSDWFSDAHDAGLWDIDYEGMNIQEMSDGGYLDDYGGAVGNLPLGAWTDVNGHWNSSDENAEAFWEKLWDLDEAKYKERDSLCYNPTAETESDIFQIFQTSFEEEFEGLVEYTSTECYTSSSSSTDEENLEEGSDLSTTAWVIIVVAAVVVIVLITAAVVCLKNKQLQKETKAQHVPHTSTVSVETPAPTAG